MTNRSPSQNAVYDALALKENSIAAGTTGQYWRGDKSWQTLDKAAVGLGNVPNANATDRANHTGTQLSSTISDFTEAAQDAIGSALTDSATVAWTYTDSANTISAAVKDASIGDSKLTAGIDAAKIGSGTVSNTEFGFLDGVSSSLQNQLDSKQATVTGAATTITSSNLTASKVLVSDSSGKVAASSTTSAEIGYLSGTTSSIQTQISGKEPTITAGNTGQYWRGDKSWQTLDKSAIGLGNVPNTDATSRSNHTGTQSAATISDFTSAAVTAVIAASISNNDTTHSPSNDAVYKALSSKQVTVSTTVLDASVSLAAPHDQTVFLNTGSATKTITAFAATAGFQFTVIDKSGTIDSYPITFARNGSQKIMGLASDYTLRCPFGMWTFTFDGTDWFVF